MKAHFLFRSVSLVIILFVLAGASSANGMQATPSPFSSQMTGLGTQSPTYIPGTNNDPQPSAGRGLTAIDVPETARPVLDRLGILYQGQARSGVLRAAGSAWQLAALGQAGVAYRTIGKVAIFEHYGQGESPRGTSDLACIAQNSKSFLIPKDPVGWGYDSNTTDCPSFGTVDWVDIHFIIANAYFSGTPPTGQGLTEIYVNLGAESPWKYVNVGESWHYCVPSALSQGMVQSPEDFGTYDRWIFNVDATMGTNIFTGRPVNQTWDLAVRQGNCPNSPQAFVTYWGIWVYYSGWQVFVPVVEN